MIRRGWGWATTTAVLAAAVLGGTPGAATAAGDADRDVGLLRPLGVRTESSVPQMTAALPGGVALFVADDDVHGAEAWRSDGTASGTTLLADLVPGPADADPELFAVDDDGVAAFAAATGPGGAPELWRTDGTPGGTTRLTSLGALGATEVRGLVPFRGGWAFTYRDAPYGKDHSAWLDGGTLRALPGFPSAAYVAVEASIHGTLFVTVGSALYRTDGTQAAPTAVAGAERVGSPTVVGSDLVVLTAAGDDALRVGVVEGDHVTDIAASGERPFLEAAGDRLYFAAPDGTGTWKRGEAARTIDASTLYSAVPYDLEAGGVVDLGTGVTLFAATDPDHGPRLHRTDGTALGSRIVPGRMSHPGALTAIGGGRALFFAFVDEPNVDEGPALWVTDGTAAGTRQIGPTVPPITELTIAPTAHGAIYPGYDDRAGLELFATDGTAAGTGLLADVNQRLVGSRPLNATVVGGRVVFTTWLQDGALWATDGTGDGTVPLMTSDADGEAPDITTVGATDDGATAYFGAADGNLYRTDGTRGGTKAVAHVGGAVRALGSLGSTFLFGRDTENFGTFLMRTDGTAAGTVDVRGDRSVFEPVVAAKGPGAMLLRSFNSATRTDGTSAGTDYLTQAANHLEAIAVPGGFLASVPTHPYFEEQELQHLDVHGVPDGPVVEIEPDAPGGPPEGSSPSGFARLAGSDDVLFAATRGGVRSWWVVDPTGQSPRRLDGPEGSAVAGAWTAAGATYVVNREAGSGALLLYRTDGTPAGTALLRRFEGAGDVLPSGFVAFAGRVYFAAADGAHGEELWVTDGTPEGTRLARDIRPGPEGSAPDDLVATDDFLFFSADDGTLGPEPWRVRRGGPAPGGGDDSSGDGEAPPVTVDPLPSPLQSGGAAWSGTAGTDVLAAALGGRPTRSGPAARVSLTVKRLSRGRWRVSGRVTGARSGCSGPVRVVLGRGSRTLKAASTKMKACAFSTTLTTTSRSSGRWIQVRTPAASSRRAAVR